MAVHIGTIAFFVTIIIWLVLKVQKLKASNKIELRYRESEPDFNQPTHTNTSCEWELDLSSKMISSSNRMSLVYKGVHLDNMLQRLCYDGNAEAHRWVNKLVQGEVLNGELTIGILNEFGKTHWVTVSEIVAIYDEKGCVTKIKGLETSIDTYVASKKELDTTKRKMEFVIRSLSAVIWEYNIENDFIWSNDTSSMICNGVSFNSYLDIHHPDDKTILKAEFDKLSSGQNDAFKIEVRLKCPNDSYSWIEVQGMIYQRNSDGVVTKIIGLRRNIESEILARQEFIRNKQRLEEYAIQTNLAMNCAGIVVWEYDMKKCMFSSRDKSSFMSKGVSKEIFLSMVYSEDIQIVDNAIELFSRGELETFNCQLRVKGIDGKVISEDITATVLSRDEWGKVLKLTGVRIDITEQLDLNLELIELRDKAEESNKLKSAFLANMSHEIRTPLNAIVGFSNLIASTDDKSEIAEYISVIEINNELLLQLINDILDLSKIEAGKLEFHMSEVDCSELMGQLQQMFELRSQEEVEVVFDKPEKDFFFDSDTNRLTQVITNFLSNAVKFTSRGSIHMGIQQHADGLYFYVRDTGKGIGPNDLPLVFERFSKFDNFIQGTGLGLSICKTIVERLGGSIGVESELGEGTLFWFTIACEVRTSQVTYNQESLVCETSSDVEELSNYKILIAEDNNDNYVLFEHALKGYHLIHAWDGEEAVELFKSCNPAIILMDVKMPKMDGYKAKTEIRKISKYIPIIAVTASAVGDERQRALNEGFTEFCAKPIDLIELNKLIVKCIGLNKTENGDSN